MENLELIIMNLVVDSGSGKSSAMEAIHYAKGNQFEAAEKALEEANEQISKAHQSQTQLLQKEAGGEKTEIGLLMVHAQDHLMTAIAVKDLAREFVDLYQHLAGKNQ